MKRECKFRIVLCIIGCMLIYPLRGLFEWMFKSYRLSSTFWNSVEIILCYTSIGIGLSIGTLFIFAGLGYLYDLFFSFPLGFLNECDSSFLQHMYLGVLIVIALIVVFGISLLLWKFIQGAWRDAIRRCS